MKKLKSIFILSFILQLVSCVHTEDKHRFLTSEQKTKIENEQAPVGLKKLGIVTMSEKYSTRVLENITSTLKSKAITKFKSSDIQLFNIETKIVRSKETKNPYCQYKAVVVSSKLGKEKAVNDAFKKSNSGCSKTSTQNRERKIVASAEVYVPN